MPGLLKTFLVGLFLLILISVPGGGGQAQAQAAIPWNCADWQAATHADRPTAILESLAENRGKALYCGVDQSDAFGKAETWAAGEHRNERDDTIYQGERGRFRGFTAAQEGYLTEGKSGITGYGADFIFEFPRPKPQRRRVKYVPVGDVSGSVTSCGTSLSVAPCPNEYGKVRLASGSMANIRAGLQQFNREVHPRLDWPAMARSIARLQCRNMHSTPHVRRVNIDTRVAGEGVSSSFVPTDTLFQLESNHPIYHAYQEREWTATCVKKVKGPRR